MAKCGAGLGLTAYYYFDFRTEAKRVFRGLLSSLLVQLSARSDSCYDVLSRLYSRYDKGLRFPDVNVLVGCLKEMLKLPRQPTVYLIVDALDECHNFLGAVPERDRLLKFIVDLVEARLPNLRICVTSRPEADIQDVLESLAPDTVSLHDENGQRKDIDDYIIYVVHSDRTMQKWRADDKKLVIDTLSQRANGM